MHPLSTNRIPTFECLYLAAQTSFVDRVDDPRRQPRTRPGEGLEGFRASKSYTQTAMDEKTN